MSESAFLRKVSLFREFDDAELAAVAAHFLEASVAAGTVLLDEGAVNRGLHVVRTGRLQVSRRVGSDEVALTVLVEGQTFGELSILDDGFASATLRALTPTTILSISANNLAAFLGKTPLAAVKFWRAMTIDLRERLLNANDLVKEYFELNRALVENPVFLEAYSLCSR
ncbi:MAG: cyclic nucleotide-binding domain-containing protein [Thermoanaerobaculia bacterium]|nr:cyclic nucleotide-binding domain-containing protein [Thermoanaerobaculia bacterium]